MINNINNTVRFLTSTDSSVLENFLKIVYCFAWCIGAVVMVKGMMMMMMMMVHVGEIGRMKGLRRRRRHHLLRSDRGQADR
jgi:hypothetical protein